MFLLDTNVVSELRKAPSGRADPRVLAWIRQTPTETTFLSTISLLELEIGVLRAERKDPRQGRSLRQWLTLQLLPAFANRILPFDSAAALRCAALHVPDPRPDRDAMIAATALAHGLTVVTRNVADFTQTGVRLLNPWTEGSSVVRP